MKITVVGAGNVAQPPLNAYRKELANEVILVDIIEGVPPGQGFGYVRIRTN